MTLNKEEEEKSLSRQKESRDQEGVMLVASSIQCPPPPLILCDNSTLTPSLFSAPCKTQIGETKVGEMVMTLLFLTPFRLSPLTPQTGTGHRHKHRTKLAYKSHDPIFFLVFFFCRSHADLTHPFSLPFIPSPNYETSVNSA